MSADGEKAQAINYLKALMLNFWSPRLDYKRLVFNLRPSASSADLSHDAQSFPRGSPTPRCVKVFCATRGLSCTLTVLLWTLLMISGWAKQGTGTELNFEPVILDKNYYAYERDVGDIDGDGDNDVVGVQEGDTTVQVFRAPMWKRSTLITFTGTDKYPRADDFKLADIDGDSDLDVITRLGPGPADDRPGIAVWCENLGDGSKFTQHVIGSSPEYAKDIVVADFDRDGRPDVVLRMDSKTQLWLQETKGNWTEVLLSHPAHEGMEAGDLDMDGDPDIILNGFWFATPNTPVEARVAANYACHTIDDAWFNQGGDWTADSCKVVAGDFDGDGVNDVAFSQSERAGHEVAWYRSSTPNGAGPWIKHPVGIVDYCHNLQATDWNLDGHIDLLVGGMIQSNQRGLKLMLNSGDGTEWKELAIQADGSYSAEIGDIDDDGDMDIVGIRNWNSPPTWIYRNNAAEVRSRKSWIGGQMSK
ncbi:MAG TPA: FG-GAP-like repeat-containing protein [Terrimicrobiaceae bacterium]